MRNPARPDPAARALASLRGVPIRIDPTWFVLAALVAWTLAAGVFPGRLPGASTTMLWSLAIGATLGLFVSVLLHELAHAEVSRRHGMPVRSITLFLLGGMSDAGREPENPQAELRIAAAGPLASAALAGLFAAAAAMLPHGGAAHVVARWLGEANLALAIFNLLPAFPMDGGRILRALLWSFGGSETRATRIATSGGRLVGLAFILLGVASLFGGQPFHAVWLALIGFFLRGAAGRTWSRFRILRTLAGRQAGAFLRPEHALAASRAIPVRELVDEFVLRHGMDTVPVVDGERLIGRVGLDTLRAVPVAEWDSTSAGAIAVPFSAAEVIPPELDASELLARGGPGEVAVVSGERFLGLLPVAELFRWSSLAAWAFAPSGGGAAPAGRTVA